MKPLKQLVVFGTFTLSSLGIIYSVCNLAQSNTKYIETKTKTTNEIYYEEYKDYKIKDIGILYASTLLWGAAGGYACGRNKTKKDKEKIIKE